MKAKLIFENINFERNVNPRDSLGLGGIKVQKKVFDDFLEKINEMGIDTTFHSR